MTVTFNCLPVNGHESNAVFNFRDQACFSQSSHELRICADSVVVQNSNSVEMVTDVVDVEAAANGIGRYLTMSVFDARSVPLTEAEKQELFDAIDRAFKFVICVVVCQF